jgi:UDP-N-acetylmuramoylalanine--D-glutamate ligase
MTKRKIVIWGVGREGQAAADFLRTADPQADIRFVDESEGGEKRPDTVRGKDRIGAELLQADLIVKSPGVSLYHPLIVQAKQKNIPVTSLLNLFFSQKNLPKTICITGTKGKSTTSSLLVHVLNKLGKKAVLLGNIGTPVTQTELDGVAYAVIETSSYQAADFAGNCDIALVTSLYPEHLDWHGSLRTYFADKLNLLSHARIKLIDREALATATENNIAIGSVVTFNDTAGLHVQGGEIYDGPQLIGRPQNAHLARPHNLRNICGVLAVLKTLDFDLKQSLAAMEGFKPLPHRQHELGEKDGVLYVDDSIATMPQSAIAALEFYRDRPVTLIAGGYDRGISYQILIDHILQHKLANVICLGPSGKRIFDGLQAGGYDHAQLADSMEGAVAAARQKTAQGGVILLSPGAPSYGLFKDFVARGLAFAAHSGF